jgi:hypothetical protein
MQTPQGFGSIKALLIRGKPLGSSKQKQGTKKGESDVAFTQFLVPDN